MQVRNEVWSLTGKDCETMATNLLINENQLDRPEKRYQRMLRQAVELKDEIVGGVAVRAVYNYYDDVYLKDSILAIDGKAFVSQTLKGIDPAQILGAYVFVLTAGDFSYPDKPMMEQVLLDLWGTAFATTGRKHLQAHFAKDGRISETFGPGLYGIPMESMRALVSLVDADLIGVTVNESSFLWPVKSYGGIVFRVADDYKPRGGSCATCRGSRLSCNLCEFNPKGIAK
ncbi:MAG: hypothetical protein II682_00045 [Firmicutes bacterium]|nr:hypothetical protein [Bacillota bacterium]